jgi:hypothetical protein
MITGMIVATVFNSLEPWLLPKHFKLLFLCVHPLQVTESTDVIILRGRRRC